ncbi:MAG: ABC transporter permease [Actinomycetes bacterium]
MTVDDRGHQPDEQALATPKRESAPPGATRRFFTSRALIVGAVLLGLLSLTRILTGADDLTSSGTTSAALRLAVPIGMAALGGLWAERSGVINIGLEGMMILGTWFGGWAGYQWGPWWGIVAGVLGGALGGLVHALATVTFGVDHIVSGVAIILLATGATQFLSVIAFEGVPGGGETQSPRVDPLPTYTVPGLSSALLDLENEGWFLLSDAAGILRALVTNLSVLTIIAAATLPLTYFVLWRTSFGLRLRSCGENPEAAESLGVRVYTMKYAAVTMSGALAGLGGAFLTIVAAGIYREGQTGGRGFIGLAAMIFGNWRPGGLAVGAGLFGYTDALQLRQGGDAVHALLLLLVIVLCGVAAWQVYRQRYTHALISFAGGAALLFAFLASDTVPSQFVFFTPHLTTLLVLSLAAQRLRPPRWIGQPYRRGQGR